MPIVDSSVFVKFLSREEGWQEAERWLIRPSTVPLALIEVANALRTKNINGDVTLEDAKVMISKVVSLVKLVDEEELISDSFQIAIEHRITVYDALFVVAAMRSMEKELVTCDNRQADVAAGLGVKVRNLGA
jgi:predicted nucleic acid-binding protein